MAVSKVKAPRWVFIAVGSAALIFLVFLAGALLFAPKQKAGDSSTSSLTPKTVQSGVGGEGNPAYNQMLDELNRNKAGEAAKKGDSYVPIPIGDGHPVEEEKPVVQVKPPKMAPQPTAAPPPPPRQTDNKAMLADLKGLMAKDKTGDKTPLVVNYVPEEKATEVAAEPGAAPVILTRGEAAALRSVKPGDLLYAVNELGINTDAPSPVMATVAMGPLKGAKAIGGFQRHDEQVVLAFSKLVLPTGEQLNMEAVAVDPATSSAAVASKVNTHFFSRWGSLIAASFLEGFGEALSDRNTQVYTTGDVVVQSSPNKSYRDISMEAMGKVGGRMANQVERGFDRPPTVYVGAGEPLGLLVLSLGK